MNKRDGVAIIVKMSKPEVSVSYSLKCRGVSRIEVDPLTTPTDVSISVRFDGTREVECDYLVEGRCAAAIRPEDRLDCIHLRPGRRYTLFEAANSAIEIKITPIEGRIIDALTKSPEPVPKDDLFRSIWGRPIGLRSDQSKLTEALSRFRRRFREAGLPPGLFPIRNEYGVGYFLDLHDNVELIEAKSNRRAS